MVADRTEQGPVGEGILQAVFPAECVDILEDSQQYGLDFLQIESVHVQFKLDFGKSTDKLLPLQTPPSYL